MLPLHLKEVVVAVAIKLFFVSSDEILFCETVSLRPRFGDLAPSILLGNT